MNNKDFADGISGFPLFRLHRNQCDSFEIVRVEIVKIPALDGR